MVFLQAAAKVIKEAMDKKYGGPWHCICGEGFGFSVQCVRAPRAPPSATSHSFPPTRLAPPLAHSFPPTRLAPPLAHPFP